jgi:3-hydroxyacyl-CoA dehydrogenase/enoyl-CoA hydratase/3-hydroxybutyryl-CoA epimerase
VTGLTTKKTDDGLLVVAYDRPDSPVNAWSRAAIEEFGSIIARLEEDESIRGAVFLSGKPNVFVAGADLADIAALDSAEKGVELAGQAQSTFDRLAECPKPVVAAINGPALGGGYELALACGFILATDFPATVVGLPEVGLGLMPAAGGTQRLPGRLPLDTALDLLLTGRDVPARSALKMGLVDLVVPPYALEDTALRAVRALLAGELGPRRFRREGRDRLRAWPLGRRVFFGLAARRVAKETRGLYPAPPAIVEAVRIGMIRGRRHGLAAERERFGRLAVSPESRALIGLFHARRKLMKIPAESPRVKIERLGVIGGGYMGAAVAALGVGRFEVSLVDVSTERLGRTYQALHKSLNRRVEAGFLSTFERDRLLASIHLTTDLAALSRADMIVEAVTENLELKRRLYSDLEKLVSPECVIAGTSSALAMADLTAGTKNPERFVAMHYLPSPGAAPLIEVGAAAKTSPRALAAARRVGVRQGIPVLQVKDGPGLFAGRLLAMYLSEAAETIADGAGPIEVDRVLLDFGFPMGPAAFLDLVGWDVVAASAGYLYRKFAERWGEPPDHFGRLVEAGYLGKKSGRGLYRYDLPRKPRPVDKTALKLIRRRRRFLSPMEIQQRLVLTMINQAAWGVQEGVVASAQEADWGAVLGLGFPAFLGGPFRFLDGYGVDRAVGQLYDLAERRGRRFAPAPMLEDKARSRRPKFYE